MDLKDSQDFKKKACVHQLFPNSLISMKKKEKKRINSAYSTPLFQLKRHSPDVLNVTGFCNSVAI